MENVLELDPRKGLAPEQLERPFEHPVVIQAARAVRKNKAFADEAAEVTEVVLDELTGYSGVASILGLLDALAIVIGNIEHDARRKNFKVIVMEK